jgi:hypothetical protein
MTEKVRPDGCWMSRSGRVDGSSWQIRRVVNIKASGEASYEAEWLIPGSQEKSLSFR